MILCIADVMTEEQLDRVRSVLEAGTFRDGRETAGWHARTVKRNTQADARDSAVQAVRSEVDRAIADNALVQLAGRPRRLKPVMFSRYTEGMEYGSHVDDAVMDSGADAIRTDLAFTIFLSSPESYDGGELTMQTTGGDETYKLPAGSMILYPASTLHRVTPITRGARLAAVGWGQSYVREPAQREILFELDTARRSLFQQHGKTEEFDTLSKSLANLMRMWSEVG